ncbi:sulfotransferase 1B1-like isoform X1 [Ptychodera flava]|uniref:sulfotransferase 1B1-like isoform X1 n=1 Tax=Ptychodera flava TaxID=63121 RepID=UPI00396A3673
MSKTEELYRNRVPRTRHDTHVYERTGHTMPWFVPSTSLDALQTFEVRSTDIFLITYPKSGTTWTRKIITLVMNDANEEMIQANIPISMKASLPEFHRNLNEEPWYKKLEKTNGRRFIPTHLAPSLLPPQVFEKPVKVIYVARNPKDAAVSYYHHYMTSPDEMPYKWEDYLSIFRSKNMAYGGDWGSHVIPWWERRNNLNVLFMKYEDMVKDLRKCVKEIAAFLEQDHLSDEQIDKIVKLCSFEYMKKNPKDRCDRYLIDTWKVDPSKSPFVRKGKVGGWKEYFTEAQNEEFDQVYKKWIGDSGLEMEFE